MIRSIAIGWAVSEPMQPLDPQEQSRIERAKGGDPDALAWLLNRYRARVIRLATHILRRPSDAEDVAQEAFVRAFRNLHAYRADSSFYTWVYQIVVRVCLDRKRRCGWDREEPLAGMPDHEASPVEETDSRLVVEALLDRLSPPMRAIIVLRELEGLEYAEIAQALNIPVGLVKWRLNRARALFQRLWEANHA